MATQLDVFDGVEIVGGAREWEDREWFPPGPQLAICLSGEQEHLADLDDDELLQVAAAARRQTSWAQARELAAIAELTRRRTAAADDAGDSDYRTLSAHEAVTEEIAAALTVTGNTAATLVHLAERLTGPLASTGDALEAGRIDMAKARVICDATENLPDQVTQRVEAAALEKASTQTTGQLRRRIRRIAQRLAPEILEERRREATRQRRLELWDTPSGTADLALCDLAVEDAHGIFNKITAAAHGLKADGDTRPLHLIRADIATNLLNGAPLPEAIATVLSAAVDAAPSASLHPPASQDSAACPTEQTTHPTPPQLPSDVPMPGHPAAPHAPEQTTHPMTPQVSPHAPTPGPPAAPHPPEQIAHLMTPRVPVCVPVPGRPDVSHPLELTARRGPAQVPSAGVIQAASLAGNGAPVVGRFAAARLLELPVYAAGGRDHSGVRGQQAAEVSGAAQYSTSPSSLNPGATGTGNGDAEGTSAARLPTAVASHPSSQAGGPLLSVVRGLAEQADRLAADPQTAECDGRVERVGDIVGGATGSAAAAMSLGATPGAGARSVDNVFSPGVAGVVAMLERRLGHLRARIGSAELSGAVDLAVRQVVRRLAPQRDALCQGDDERHGRPGYRPPAGLRREIEERHATCVFPTCNRASHRCDLDHTVPWRPGITCRCNLAPLCRRHHRLKQSPGWNLHHVWPGVLVWTTPAGAWYIVRPDRP
ncbi:HNH endonuclease signature motif containing protein [Actinomadura livida]|uniref:DUF222 domain-containing protein n=1 Tax=Actinomadura livida TaxID=79909 RepID=A0A7W7MX85_9ACTN|nr:MULTISPECIES: HNH endonuclease signature motif containing protein [Actinomadura]MBB4773540.1 hypothetical protein [Actinomadura catellatispora]GGU09009.1 hypothetical protein GCM10010208_36820 [Actinomadura livida]